MEEQSYLHILRPGSKVAAKFICIVVMGSHMAEWKAQAGRGLQLQVT